jgi:VanZ family protein
VLHSVFVWRECCVERIVRYARWIPALAWMVVIFAASSVPGSDVPGRFGYWAHFVEYVVLGMALAFALQVETRRLWLAAVALAAVYAATDELHQAFVPGRNPDVLDWLTDVAGAATGAAVIAVVRRKAAFRRPS